MKRFCFLLCFYITVAGYGQTINLDTFSKPGVIVCSSTRIKKSQEACFIVSNEVLYGKLNAKLNLFVTGKRVDKIDAKLLSCFQELTADSVGSLVQEKFLKPEGADVYYEYLTIFTKSTGRKIFELPY